MRKPAVLIFAICLLAFAAFAAACPNCDATIANSDSAGAPGISAAFNSSIYLMLGAFLAVLGLVTTVIIKAIRGS